MATAPVRNWFQNRSLRFRQTYGFVRRQILPDAEITDNNYRRLLTWLEETQWWPEYRLRELQLFRLRALLNHAYRHVPYYHNLFNKHHIRPADIHSLEDLQMIPVTTRADVHQNVEAFIPANVDRKKLHTVHTGGTTGVPLTIYYDALTHAQEEAFRIRQWRWAGYRQGDRVLVLRDDFYGRRGPQGALIKWDYETTHNALILSTFHLNQAVMPEYIRMIREFQPQYIDAFSSALGILAIHMKEQGVEDIRVRAVFLESETIYPWQRKLIQEQFGCYVYGAYGNSERAMDAVECEQHDGYHHCMEYGIIEILDERGYPVTKEGAAGVVTGTGLNTFCMPMIRYRTDDIAYYTSRRCSCGRDTPLIAHIEGRTQDVIVTRNDELVPVGVLHIRALAYQKLRQFQFHQDTKGELTIRVIPGPMFGEEDAKVILEELNEQFHGQMTTKLIYVEDIPRTARGKYRFMDQELRLSFQDENWHSVVQSWKEKATKE